MTMHRTLIGLLASLTLLGACDSASNPAASSTSRVTVKLTDAPAALASAQVQIKQIYLTGGADSASSRVVLFDGDQTYDLLDLQSGLTADLANISIPAGTYGQLRLVVGDVSLTTLDGQTYSTADGSLKCPSCSQSGLKINLPHGALDLTSPAEVVVLDFDVAQSFGHKAGMSGNWVMHPVINASDLEVTGSIAGTVALADSVALPDCGGDSVQLSAFQPTATSAALNLTGTVDATGKLLFPFVPAGDYTMAQDSVVFANGDVLRFTAAATPAQLSVTSGSEATVDYTISDAVCTAATPAA